MSNEKDLLDENHIDHLNFLEHKLIKQHMLIQDFESLQKQDINRKSLLIIGVTDLERRKKLISLGKLIRSNIYKLNSILDEISYCLQEGRG